MPTLNRWQCVVAVLLGALMGDALLFSQSIAVNYAWMAYANIFPISTPMPTARIIGFICRRIVNDWRFIVQVLVGLPLGALTTYTWLQRDQHRGAAGPCRVGGLLLLAVILPYRLYMTNQGYWLLAYARNRGPQMVFVFLSIFDLALWWTIGLIWWAYRLSDPRRRN